MRRGNWFYVTFAAAYCLFGIWCAWQHLWLACAVVILTEGATTIGYSILFQCAHRGHMASLDRELELLKNLEDRTHVATSPN